LAVPEKFVIVVVAAQAPADVGEVHDEIDALDPIYEF
jgi:hypothetical protein